MWAVALRTCGDREIAADAVQDGFLAAFRRADSFRGDAAVTTWLHRIVVNACLDRLRRRRPTSPLPEYESLELADRHDDHAQHRVGARRPGRARPAARGAATRARPRRHARPRRRRGGPGARRRRGDGQVPVRPRPGRTRRAAGHRRANGAPARDAIRPTPAGTVRRPPTSDLRRHPARTTLTPLAPEPPVTLGPDSPDRTTRPGDRMDPQHPTDPRPDARPPGRRRRRTTRGRPSESDATSTRPATPCSRRCARCCGTPPTPARCPPTSPGASRCRSRRPRSDARATTSCSTSSASATRTPSTRSRNANDIIVFSGEPDDGHHDGHRTTTSSRCCGVAGR